MIPIALQKPKVVQPKDPTTVVIWVPCNPHDASEHIEVTLQREDAHRFGLNVMLDAERAKACADAKMRRMARAFD